MNGPGVWIGHCVTRRTATSGGQGEGDAALERASACHAAVWTNSREEFDAAVGAWLASEGRELIRSEEVMPVIAWFERHGYHSVVEALARRVDARHPIALGSLSPVEQAPVEQASEGPIARAPSDCVAWVGHCFFRRWQEKPAGTSAFIEPDFKDYACHAAVWTDHLDGFVATVKRHLEAEGYAFTWAEEILPAVSWMSRHGYHTEIERLAPSVGPRHHLAMGDFARVDERGEPIRETWLTAEEISGIEPLDAQFGVHPMKRVPEALHAPLFGEPEPTMRTFALLDAAKVKWLPERLADSGLAFRCLFTGKAQDELKAVAPYLVELVEENDLSRQLFTRSGFASDMWDAEPGIFVRSRDTLDEMCRHFRRFTRVRDAQGEWFHFRFWESRYLVAYCQAIAQDLERVQHWFLRHGAMPLSLLVICVRQGCAWRFAPSADLPLARPRTPFLYAEREQAVFRQVRRADSIDKLARYLSDRNGDVAARREEERREIAGTLLDDARRAGFRIEKAVADFALASLQLGRPLVEATELEPLLSARTNELNKGRLLLRNAQTMAAAEASKGDDHGNIFHHTEGR